jgi:hypothetical protein
VKKLKLKTRQQKARSVARSARNEISIGDSKKTFEKISAFYFLIDSVKRTGSRQAKEKKEKIQIKRSRLSFFFYYFEWAASARISPFWMLKLIFRPSIKQKASNPSRFVVGIPLHCCDALSVECRVNGLGD